MSQLRLGSRPTIAKTVLAINHPVPEFGAFFASDTSEHTTTAPRFWTQIQCLTDAVIDIDKSNWGGSALTAVTLKAGTTIYGQFARFKLASGTVAAYYGTD
jgi:hypothetical protein